MYTADNLFQYWFCVYRCCCWPRSWLQLFPVHWLSYHLCWTVLWTLYPGPWCGGATERLRTRTFTSTLEVIVIIIRIKLLFAFIKRNKCYCVEYQTTSYTWNHLQARRDACGKDVICSYGKGHTLQLSRAETTVPINTKFCTNDYVGQTKRVAKLCSNRLYESGFPCETHSYRFSVFFKFFLLHFLLVSSTHLQTTIHKGFDVWCFKRRDLA